LPAELPQRRHIYNQYIIRFTDGRSTRDAVMSHLKSAGIGCDIYYPLTLPQQECFAGVPSSSDKFPNSDIAADQTLAIPIFPELTEGQLNEVVSAIAKALG